MVTLPFGFALLASALQKYPLRGRLILFLAPMLLLLAAEGLRCVQELLARWRPAPAGLASLALGALLLWPLVPGSYAHLISPPRPEDLRPIVAYISQHGRPGDLYYASGGRQAFAYYAQVYGLDPDHIRSVTYAESASYPDFVRDMAGLAGQGRVWVVFPLFDSSQRAPYLEYLNHSGKLLDSVQSTDTRGYLFDLSP
jgi:hypothetical protein